MYCVPSVDCRRSSGLKRAGVGVLLAGGTLLLAACAGDVWENPVEAAGGTPLAVPAHWQNLSAEAVEAGAQEAGAGEAQPLVQDAAALAQWWTQFNDPVLDQLIASALQTSPSIRTALAKVEESRARRGISRGNLLPSLSGSVSGRGSRTRDHNAGQTSSSQNYTASLQASWEIDLFGRNRLSLSAATADLKQTEENFYAAQVSLVAEVAEAYVQLRSSQSQLDVLRRNIAARAQTTELTQWRAQAGDVSEMEAQQALSTLEQAKASIPSVELTQSQSRNRLSLLSGLTPGSLDALLEQVQPVPVAAGQIAVVIPAQTLRQRPDVRAAENSLIAAVLRTRVSELERLPTLSLSGSIGIEAMRAGRIFSPDATIASLMGSLVAPLFEGGKIEQGIALSEAQRTQALIAYEWVILTALTEVEDALIAVRQHTDRLEVLNRAAASATLAATLASQRYEAGQADLLTVLEAQRTQLSLEEQQVNTRASLTIAHIQLYKVLGGGWSATPVEGEAAPTAASAADPASAPGSASASTSDSASAPNSASASTPAPASPSGAPARQAG